MLHNGVEAVPHCIAVAASPKETGRPEVGHDNLAYSSYSACRQYLDDIERARRDVGDDAPRIDKIRQYYDHPGFVEPMVRSVGITA